MTKQDILNYYKGWGGNATGFVNMLMSKAYLAKKGNIRIMAHKRMRTGAELEKMLIIADDLAIEGIIK